MSNLNAEIGIQINNRMEPVRQRILFLRDNNKTPNSEEIRKLLVTVEECKYLCHEISMVAKRDKLLGMINLLTNKLNSLLKDMDSKIDV